MLKVLKLHKAVYAIILGVLLLAVAQIMTERKIEGNTIVLAFSGVFLIIGALLFLYPILFAKKIDKEGSKVELQPMGSEENVDENS